MHEQVGWRAFERNVRQEAAAWANVLPQFPRLLHRALVERPPHSVSEDLARIAAGQQRQNRLLLVAAALLAGLLALQLHNLLFR